MALAQKIIWDDLTFAEWKSQLSQDNISSDVRLSCMLLTGLWQEIAAIIGYPPDTMASGDSDNEDAIVSISRHFPVVDSKSPLVYFYDADTAIKFFRDMRTIRVLFFFHYCAFGINKYTPLVQEFIKICQGYRFAILDHGDKILPLIEKIICLLIMTINNDNLDPETLSAFIEIVKRISSKFESGSFTCFERFWRILRK